MIRALRTLHLGAMSLVGVLLAAVAPPTAASVGLTIEVRGTEAVAPAWADGETRAGAGAFELVVRADAPVSRIRLQGDGEGCTLGRLVDAVDGDDPTTAADDDPDRRIERAVFEVSLAPGERCELAANAWFENFRWAGAGRLTVRAADAGDGSAEHAPARHDVTRGTDGATPMDTSSPTVAQSAHGTRVYCVASHYAHDDPIVHPGRPGAAHLHLFWGNTSADASGTAASLADGGRASCEGGRNNRSAYWAPALFDARGQVVLPETIFVYYKSFGNEASFDRGTIRPIPDGLEMLANRDVANVHAPGAFTVAPHGGGLRVRVRFPNCLAVDAGGNPVLASDDNVSHLAYESARSGNPNLCPDSHPYRIPQLSYIIGYDVAHASDWRLSSDGDGPQGESLHADYLASWDEETMHRIVLCNVESKRDCQFVGRGEDGRARYRDQLPERFASPTGEPLYRHGTALLPGADRTPFGTRLAPMRHGHGGGY